jgi:hypothetical protein
MNSELHLKRTDPITRRWFLRDCGVGLAGLAFNSLLQREASGAATVESRTKPAPHFPARAKRVIYLFQAGAPSQFELFDHKPELTKRSGQLPPAELLKGYRSAFINPNSALLGPKFKFAQHGQSGRPISELLPHTSSVVDELCFIHSMHTEAVNHAPGQIMMNTGSMPPPSVPRSIPCAASTTSRSASITIPRRHRAFTVMRWLTGCKPARPS